MNNKTGPCRALVANGMRGTAVVLATDNAALKWEVENIPSDSVDDVLGDWLWKSPPGLYLFEGEGEWKCHGTGEGLSEPELKWDGTWRTIKLEEYDALLAMEAPDESERPS